MAMRCRWPPENSCGYRVAARAGRPTRSSSSATRRRRPAASRSVLITSGSATMAPTRMRGSSDAYGSWKTAWTERRYARSPSRPSADTSRPSNRMLPAVGFSRPRMSLDVVVLPQPDSPTRPRVAPAGMSNETQSTARTRPVDQPRPRRTAKCFVRLVTSSSGAPDASSPISAAMQPAARRVAGDHRGLGRRLDAAAREGRRTARGERAAGTARREVGGLAGDRGEERAPRAEARDGFQQRACVRVRGLGEDPPHGADLDDAPRVHDGHAVADARHDPEVVGDEDHREPVTLLQLLQQAEVLRLDGEVEARGRLVGDEQARGPRDGHGADDALAHPARELVRKRAQPRGGRGDAHGGQQLRRARGDGAAAQAVVHREGLAYLHADGEDRIERGHRVLQDHRDLAPADLLHLGLALRQQILAVEANLAAHDARGRPRHEADDAQARHALAGARLTDEAECFALVEREGHAVHRLDRSPAGDDVRAEIADVDDGQ